MENFGNVCTQVVAVRISVVTFEVSKTNLRAIDETLLLVRMENVLREVQFNKKCTTSTVNIVYISKLKDLLF